MSNDPTRRRFVTAAGSTLTTLSVAGCLGGSGSTPTETDDGMTEGGTTETDGGGMGTETDGGMRTETDGEMDPVTFTVRIENTAPTDFYGADTSTSGAIWLTPGAFAVHTDANPIFTEGEAASVGLEALAEAGPPTGFPDQPGLVEELRGTEMGIVSAGAYTPAETVADPNDPQGEAPGAPPIAPGGAFEFTVESPPGTRLSFASMFVPSNDLFVAPGESGIALWDDGSPVEGDATSAVGLWDAGTEPNQQPGRGPNQAPAQNSPDQGADENGVVRPLSAVTSDDFSYPAVADVVRVTVTPDSG